MRRISSDYGLFRLALPGHRSYGRGPIEQVPPAAQTAEGVAQEGALPMHDKGKGAGASPAFSAASERDVDDQSRVMREVSS